MDLDTALKEIGQFGIYQLRIYILLLFPFALHSIATMSYVFTTSDLHYRCEIPGCDRGIPEFNATWIKNVIPFRTDGEIEDPCKRFRYIGGFENCTVDHFIFNQTEKCEKFVFETSEITIGREFNLLCNENKWKMTAVGTLNNVAQFIGLPISGMLSDRYGRKVMATSMALTSSVLGVLKSFSSSYIEYILFEMLDAMATAGLYTVLYVLALEMTGPEMRGFCGVVMGSYYPIGAIILGAAAWYFNDWRQYLRVLYGPGLLFVSYYWILPESFRWLINNNKKKKAIKNLRIAAKVNGNSLSEDVNQFLEKLEKNIFQIREEDEKPKASLKEALSSRKIFLWTLNGSYCWITQTFVFYGISLSSVSIGGNKYLSFILVCLVEIPANFLSWFLIDRFGRRNSVSSGLILCGLVCGGFTFLPKDADNFKLVLFLAGKFAITVSFASLNVLCAEMFPTQLRNTLIGLCSTVGRFGSMLAPQAPLFATFCDPMIVFGSAAIVSGLLALYFPETLNRKLPDNITDTENLAKEPIPKEKGHEIQELMVMGKN